ncbi:MAG: hypothetical protein JW395_0780 [Nitrospira sp.]|nr:hypothetical protein [Nitrospira sp.]
MAQATKAQATKIATTTLAFGILGLFIAKKLKPILRSIHLSYDDAPEHVEQMKAKVKKTVKATADDLAAVVQPTDSAKISTAKS